MPSNRLKLAVVGAIGLLVIVVAVLGVALVNRRSAPSTAPDKVAIEISDTACSPNAVTVAAGAPTFSIKNTSGRAIEWEILDGVMVLAERENIAPGFALDVTPRLKPGTYKMTCGLLSNAPGSLTVTAADGSTTALPAAPTLADLVAPTAEYRVYAIRSAEQLGAAATALQSAVTAGDLAAARTHLADAATALAQIAPVLHLFDREANPLLAGPTSFGALDKTLAAASLDSSTAGLVDVTRKSAVDLGGTIHSTTASPHEIVAGAGQVVADLAKATDFGPTAIARIAGVRKVIELFRPLTARADKSLATKLDADLAATETALAQNTAQPARLADLAADLVAMQAALGLSTT